MILSGCASFAKIDDQKVYFIKESKYGYRESGPFLVYEFSMDRLFVFEVVNGGIQARLYIPPVPRGEVYGALAPLYLVDDQVCKEINAKECYIRSDDISLKSIKPEARYYKYKAIYSIFHRTDHNSDEGAINILESDYQTIELYIGAWGKPFQALKSEPYVLQRQEVIELWKESINH
jgi:hypothetical protein